MVNIDGLFGKNDRQNQWTPSGELSFEKGLYEDVAAACAHLTSLRPEGGTLRVRLAELTMRS